MAGLCEGGNESSGSLKAILTEGLIDPHLVFCSDEAWFHLTGRVIKTFTHAVLKIYKKSLFVIEKLEFGVLLAQDE
ncbi:hypothetical protein ANN_04728 [Periplaneta americana]|uniref:Uncharacterized protein n=1 Tax=Periplaneta americana TaxID=6978 RepID=A0ABQ8TA03_PERAM|nr:hypothetical protein ANN_04728 [Periplaneta americana]